MNSKISIVFFGTPEFACPSLIKLKESSDIEIKAVVTQTSKPKGRGQIIQNSEIFNLAKELKINTILRPNKLKHKENSPEDIDFLELSRVLENEAIDLGVVVAYGKLIPESMLNIPKFGFINIHPSDLPLWRGAAPLQHTILSGADNTKVCIIKLLKELDAGPIFASKELKNINNLNLQDLHNLCSKIGAELLIETIQNIYNQKISATPQSTDNITYAHRWTKNDCKINFSESAHTTYNRIRACSPKPGAFCLHDKLIIKIFLSKLRLCPNNLKKGQLSIIKNSEGKDSPCISLDENHLLEIEELQLEGKSKILGSDFLNIKNLKDRLKSGEEIFFS